MKGLRTCWIAFTLALSSGVAFAQRASAEDGRKEECSFAYESAQVLRRDGDLVGAKKKLQFCSGFQCPNVMLGDCQRWLSEVEASIPTVVFQVETNPKTNLEKASVSVDGASSTALDGRAITMNPGKHSATISASGFLPVTRVFDILEGEKLRREVIVLAPEPKAGRRRDHSNDTGEPPAGEPPASRLTLPIVLVSAVAVLGGAGAVYFGLSARDKEGNLDACSPNCDRSAVNATKRDYLLANASIGVAGAGALTAAVLVLVLLKSPNNSPNQTRLGLATQPNTLPGLSLTGSF